MTSASVSRLITPLIKRLPQNGVRSTSLAGFATSNAFIQSQPNRNSSPSLPRPQGQQQRSFIIPRPKKTSQPQRSETPSAEAASTDARTSTLGATERSKKLRVETQPHYNLHFTCVPCGHPSGHKISKQGYHHGSVLITCSECKNRHVISDHLGIFGDRKITVEHLMRERGRAFRKGLVSENGDIEFWDDAEVSEAQSLQPPATA